MNAIVALVCLVVASGDPELVRLRVENAALRAKVEWLTSQPDKPDIAAQPPAPSIPAPNPQPGPAASLANRILFFTQPICGGCVTAESEIASWLERAGWDVVRVNVVVDPETSNQYGITSTPTFVVIRGGKESARYAGSNRAEFWGACHDAIESNHDGSEDAATPQHEVDRILAKAPVPKIGFVDPGCGDGRWLIAAAKRWSSTTISGVEIDPGRADEAASNIAQAGLTDRAQVIVGDATQTDVDADVGAAYLYPDVLAALRPKIEKMEWFASYMHKVPGLSMTRDGDFWIWKKPQPAQTAQSGYVTWGGRTYGSDYQGCGNPNCGMCYGPDGILALQGRLKSTPACATCNKPARSGWNWFWGHDEDDDD